MSESQRQKILILLVNLGLIQKEIIQMMKDLSFIQ